MLLQNILKCDYWDQRNENVLLSPKSVEQESLSPLHVNAEYITHLCHNHIDIQKKKMGCSPHLSVPQTIHLVHFSGYPLPITYAHFHVLDIIT